MLSTRIRGKIMPTRNKPQKISVRVTTSQYETSGKNNTHLLSRNLPAGECSNDFGYSWSKSSVHTGI